MNIKEFMPLYSKNKNKTLNTLNEFFADVVLGVGQWEWRSLVNGKRIICEKEAVFSDGFSITNKQTAISALTKYADDMGIDLSENIQSIESARGIQLHSVLPYQLYLVMSNAEQHTISAA